MISWRVNHWLLCGGWNWLTYSTTQCHWLSFATHHDYCQSCFLIGFMLIHVRGVEFRHRIFHSSTPLMANTSCIFNRSFDGWLGVFCPTVLLQYIRPKFMTNFKGKSKHHILRSDYQISCNRWVIWQKCFAWHAFSFIVCELHRIESDKTTSIYNVSTRVLSKK